MKASEIRELNDADLTARIAELEEERFRLRFRGATEQLEDPLRQRGIRRDIARLKTVQAERKAQQGTGTKGSAQGATSAKGTTGAAKKSARGGKGTKAARTATGGTTTKATSARKAPAKKAATGAGR
jgi:large subunit ribosomal protein L29